MKSYEQIMHEKGLKLTKQRFLVFDILQNADEPLEVEQIYQRLIQNQINLSTIYRTLEVFEQKDIVIKNTFTNAASSTYEINRQEHKHHLLCTECRKIVAISGCPLAKYVMTLAEETGYDIVDHKLEILGICPECKKNYKSNSN